MDRIDFHKVAADSATADKRDGDIGDGIIVSTRRRSLARQPVSVRLSASERRCVAVAALACGGTPSDFIRRAALAAAGQPLSRTRAARDALAQETARAVGQLGKIGNLVNQIAKVANAAGRLPERDAAYAYERVARELAAARLALINRDGDSRV